MKVILLGGAGGIGSQFVDKLILNNHQVTVYDNFTSGKRWHIQQHLSNKNLNVIFSNVEDNNLLTSSMIGHDLVIHLASNPDIAKAAIQPDIDFLQGTVLTNSCLEAMRKTNIKRLIYASGSGTYGDLGEIEGKESDPTNPISTYGASKLAGEALIRAYCHMFDFTATIGRFGNVAVGRTQTHGVVLDFVNQLKANPKKLTILGDGNQSKSYIYVSDVVDAMLLADEKNKSSCEVYNVATGDYVTVTEIADIVTDCFGLTGVEYIYTGGTRGWRADVPIVRLNTDKIKSIGWSCKNNTREAIKKSALEIINNVK